jgi:hypothetical protein
MSTLVITEPICGAKSWWMGQDVVCHLPPHRIGSADYGTYRGAHCGKVEGHEAHFRWWRWGHERRAYSWTTKCRIEEEGSEQ